MGNALSVLWAALALTPSLFAQAPCSSAQQAQFPKAIITNGPVQAVLYLPDSATGYYRASRFDWSGVIPCLSYRGHSFFGIWFPHYDPMLADAIAGPVEEFRTTGGALQYDNAKAGDPFVKLGVGILRKTEETPYQYMTTYPLLDGGHWTVRAGRRQVTFRQQLRSSFGVAYDYRKAVKLDPHQPVLLLEHSLKNTGASSIETDVYEHDFFMLDDAPTAPGMIVRFPWEPKAQQSLGPAAAIEGKQIVYRQALEPRQSATSFLTGFSSNPSDYDIVVENQTTGTGVEQTGDMPISKFNFWSIRTTICPEAYIHLSIPPGKTAHWTIRYRFYTR